MKIFFENINCFYLGACVLLGLTLLLPALKIKRKACFLLYFLSIFFLISYFSHSYIYKKTKTKGNVFLIDISSSMPNNDNIYKKISPLFEKDKDKIFLFSKNLTPFPINIEDLKNKDLLTKSWESLILNETLIYENLKKIIEQNFSKKIILYTDGYEKNNDILNALNNNLISDIKIYPIIPDFENEVDKDNIQKDIKVYYKETQKSGKKAFLRMVIKNKGNFKGKISFFQENKLINEENINFSDFFTKDLYSNAINQGLNNIKISIADNNGIEIYKKNVGITGIKKESILLLSNSLNDAFFLEKIFKNIGLNVESFIDDKSSEYLNLHKYSLIILNNYPYSKLGVNNAKNISTWVKNGGSLLMIGGDHSLGLGGYKNTYIEDVLPVVLKETSKKVTRQNIGIALILDSSGSMEDDSKIDFLKLASSNFIKNLNDDDYLGIVGFNTNSFTVFPISKVKGNKNLAIESLNLLKPLGGTNLEPALNDAVNMLSKVKTSKKHILLLTDGKVPGNPKTFLDLTQVTRMLGNTLSTILLGSSDGKALLEEMAKIGKGKFYQSSSAKNLPNIFIKDLEEIKNDFALKENILNVKTKNLKSIALNEFPILKGYVISYPKTDSNVELTVSSFGEESPLLVSKNFGLSKTYVFTSDMNGRWSSEWIKWDNIHIFWKELIDGFFNDKDKAKNNLLDYNFSFYVKDSSLFLELITYNNISFKDLNLDILFPDKKLKNIKLQEEANGRYVAKISDFDKGEYKAFIKYKDKNEDPVIFYIDKDYKIEEKHQKPNLEILNYIAAKTNAVINPSKEILNTKDKISQKTTLDNLIIALGLIFFILGIIKREKN